MPYRYHVKSITLIDVHNNIIVFLSYVTDTPVCYPGLIAFDRPMTTYDDRADYITGYPTVCYNGALAPICNTTNLDALDISTICAFSAGLLGYLAMLTFWAL